MRLRWVLTIGVLALAVAAGAFAFTIYDQFWTQLPPIARLLAYRPAVATRVYAGDGSLVGEFYFEKRYLTPIGAIPEVVRNAFVAAEDSSFYTHPGIDFLGITRAALANFRAGNVVQGGSTITQQVVKALLLTPERSYRRKLREAMLSLKIEHEMSKEEILYLYLNQIYLGDGNHGIGAAAESYFGKNVVDLDLAEAALLAGLPKAPSRYSPTRNPEGALVRQRYVLRRMLDENFITLGQYRTALRRGLPVQAPTREPAKEGSYYVEYVRRSLIDRFGTDASYNQGFRVHTSMDPGLQRLAEETVREGIEQLDQQLGYLGALSHLPRAEVQTRIDEDRARPELQELQPGAIYPAVVTAARAGSLTVTVGVRTASVDTGRIHWHPSIEPAKRRFEVGDIVEVATAKDDASVLRLSQTPKVSAALVVLDPRDGAVKALVGGYDFGQSQFNRATQAYRQPGSAFKPFVYSAALDRGYTPSSIILDAPIQFIDHDKIWRPQNFSRRFYGPTTLRRALEQSQNVVTVRIVQDLGVGTVAKYVNTHFAFSRPVGRNLSLGLGTSEVTPLELASAYSAFANGGRRADPLFITRIEDSEGNLVEENKGKITDTISPQTAYLITTLLEGVVQNGTGHAAYVLDRPVAGKTGTTNEQVDAWFVGYTPDLLAAVWIGYDDNRTLGPKITGGKIATPLWTVFMQKALEGHPVMDFEMPDGIRCVNIDPESGLRARANNMRAYLECFKDGSEPQQFTPEWHYDEPVYLDAQPTAPPSDAPLPAAPDGSAPLAPADGATPPIAPGVPPSDLAPAGVQMQPLVPSAGAATEPPPSGVQPTAPSVLPRRDVAPDGADTQPRVFEPLARATPPPSPPAPPAGQIFQ